MVYISTLSKFIVDDVLGYRSYQRRNVGVGDVRKMSYVPKVGLGDVSKTQASACRRCAKNVEFTQGGGRRCANITQAILSGGWRSSKTPLNKIWG